MDVNRSVCKFALKTDFVDSLYMSEPFGCNAYHNIMFFFFSFVVCFIASTVLPFYKYCAAV